MGVTFATPAWLWALLAIPILALIEWRAVTRADRAARSLAGPRQPNALLAQRLPRERAIGMALRVGALCALLLGAAGPQWGRETVRRQSHGSDLVFAIDVSQSMDARDVPPTRLDEARRGALALLDRVQGSRVGVLVFAGDAARLCPLTLDHAAVRLTLQTLSTSSLSAPGTDLGRALQRSFEMLPSGRREEQAIVLWTDGEDHEGRLEPALVRARAAGVRVFAVGVGTPAGDVIPVYNDQGAAVDLKRDEDGNVVRSRLGERALRELGSATRGGYFRAARPGGELSRLAAAMGALARSQRGARLVERPVARFGWFALLAASLLVAEQLRWRRRSAVAATRAAGANARAAGVAAALVLGLAAARAEAQSAWARGDAAFRAGEWARAESLYARRARRGAPAPVHVNLATARARLGRKGADRALSRLTADQGRAGQAAGYNLGTVYGEQRDYERALQELRRALERDPGDADARWNYELLAREQARQQPKSSDQPKPNPQQQQPQPQPGQQGNSGQPPAPPQQQGGAQQPPPPSSGVPQSTSGGAPGMTREEAERLLGSLEEQERMERQRARRARGVEEKKGKDW